MSLTEKQLYIVSVSERTCSAISLLSTGAVTVTYLSRKEFRKPINRLIVRAALANIMVNVATFIGRTGLDRGKNSPLCQFQGLLVQWFLPADALWALCIAFNVYLMFLHKYTSAELQRLEWRYMLFCYMLPFIPAITLLFLQTSDRGKVYGPALFQCWISLPWNALRIALLFAPVWLILLVIFAIYCRVGVYIYLEVKQIRRLGVTTTDWVENIDELVDTTSIEEGQEPNAPGNPISTYSDVGELVRGQSIIRMGAWAYLGYAFLFYIALLVTWVPPSVNRVTTFIHPEFISFGLNFATAFVISLQGFWNCIIYFTITRKELKALQHEFAVCTPQYSASNV
ncbi:hypothetical protein GE09DRAFT_1205390 [Coniochaeta sp. 2T2.1]|nr:hypothetical protein GE09DRAFT_1205390 [Coniochaeta sp. 2T2.1]